MAREADGADVAIVGIGCRVPPAVCGPERLWEFLLGRGDAVRDIPSDRWRWEAYYDADVAKPGFMHVRRAALLDQRIEEFDAQFFQVAPREAAQLDPQQRLLLEVSWEAFEDAGLDVWGLRGSATGVFMGAFILDNLLQRLESAARDQVGPHTAMGCTGTVLASRLSYFYDLRGPSFVVDTACSSSLVAVHHAVRALLARECDLALAGGVNRIFRPEPMLMMSKGQYLAADGRSKAFSALADGYGRGEGCGLVVLKRLGDAERDGDHIYAVIEGSGVNQDGRTDGPSFPSAEAQAQLVQAVLDQAGVDPHEVSFVEAHGTGTPVGDPAEMRALGATIGCAGRRQTPCAVGSIKTGIGHLEGAAGVMGLIKGALVAQRGVAPPQAWLDEPNPEIDFGALGLHVPTSPVDLNHVPGRRRVAVNSFGYGGTNAHVLLREYDETTLDKPRVGPNPSSSREFFRRVAVVSGHTEQAAAAVAAGYAERLDSVETTSELQNTLARMGARTAHKHRHVVVTEEWQIKDVLLKLAAGDSHPDVIVGRARPGRLAAPVFVFSGMGPQWWAMGRGLLEGHTGFRAHVQRCDEVFRDLAGWSIFKALSASEHESQIGRTAVAQPCNFALQTGIAAVLAEVGVTPAAVGGHSVGEVAAAHVAGVLDLEDALAVTYHRSRLQETTAGAGGMLATQLREDEAQDLVAAHSPAISVAAINSDNAVTLAGDEAVLREIERDLARRDVFCRMLPVEVAYHSPAMDPILDDLHSALSGIEVRPAHVPVYSTVDQSHDNRGWGTEYWPLNAREPVAFADAVRRMAADGHRMFVDIGAHPVLSVYIRESLRAVRDVKVIASLDRRREDHEALSETIAQLWVSGVDVDWGSILGRLRPWGLPTYPWQRQDHWQEPAIQRGVRTGEPSGPHVMGGQVRSTFPLVREVDLSPNAIPWCREHRVEGLCVFPAMGYLEAIAAHERYETGGSQQIVVDDLKIERPLVLPDNEDPILRLSHESDGDRVRVASRLRTDAVSWRHHATARLSRGRYTPPPEDAQHHDREGWENLNLDIHRFYERLRALGLDYGPAFQAVQGVRHRGSCVEVDLVRVQQAGYIGYPPLLDAGLHGVLAVHAEQTTDLYVPVGIHRAIFHGPLDHPETNPTGKDAHRALVARGRILPADNDRVHVDLSFWQSEGDCLVELRNIELRRVTRANRDMMWLDSCSYEPAWLAHPHTDQGLHRTPQHLLLVGPPPGLAEEVTRRLPDTRVTVAPTMPREPDEITGVDGVIVCLEPVQIAGDHRQLEQAVMLCRLATEQARGDRSIDVVIVTENACAVLADDRVTNWPNGWVTGLRRVAENEASHVGFRHIDHDGTDFGALAAAITETPGEEIALRHGQRYRPELRRLPASHKDRHWWSVAGTHHPGRVESYALARTGPTMSGTAWVAAARRPPDPGEIELRVDIVGLNYKDILKQLGVLSDAVLEPTFIGMALGMEAFVVVERVGADITQIRVGDRYYAALAGGAFRRYITTKTTDVRLVPAVDSWTKAEATALLIAFGTAHRALAELGGLSAGETVLVHGATGAVGLAALQVASAQGAHVIATASTVAKRRLLQELGVEHTFDSRTLNFADQILELTDGRGVDVVLNTLHGDGLRANLEVAADGGRVIDITKRDISDDSSLTLGQFDKALSFISLDLDRLARDAAQFLALSNRVQDRVRAGIYTPIPVTTHPAAEITDAIAMQARSEHIGKVAIDLRNTRALRVYDTNTPANMPRADRWYLITGGTGALGQQLAAWLADRGASHIALVGRRGHLDSAGKELVAQLRANGTRVEVASVDIRDAHSTRKLLADLRATDVPIGGLIHAAGITHDRPLLAITPQDVDLIADPKIVGAQNLHDATLDDPLDWFVLISSVSTITGTSRQAVYAAANAAMEAFAHWRRRQGRPATALALGPVADAGMAAHDDQIAKYVELLGFTPLRQHTLAHVFDRMLDWNRPVLAAFDLDWQTWAHAEARAADSGRFTSITEPNHATDAGSALWSELRHLTDDQRIAKLAQHVKNALEQVLGVERDSLDPDASPSALGLDSLMLLELQTHLNRTLGAELALMGLLGLDTIIDIARAIDAAMEAP